MPDTFVPLSEYVPKLPKQQAKKAEKKYAPKVSTYPSVERLFPDQEWG